MSSILTTAVQAYQEAKTALDAATGHEADVFEAVRLAEEACAEARKTMSAAGRALSDAALATQLTQTMAKAGEVA